MPVRPTTLNWDDYANHPQQIPVGIDYYQRELINTDNLTTMQKYGQMILNLKYLQTLLSIKNLPTTVIQNYQNIIQHPDHELMIHNEQYEQILRTQINHLIKQLLTTNSHRHRTLAHWMIERTPVYVHLYLYDFKQIEQWLRPKHLTPQNLMTQTFQTLQNIQHHQAIQWSQSAIQRMQISQYMNKIIMLKRWRKFMYQIIKRDFEQHQIIAPDPKFVNLTNHIIKTR